MASKSKSEYHSESKSPSSSPPTSPLHLNPELEVARVSTTATHPDISEQSTVELPEVESLIHKLSDFPFVLRGLINLKAA